MKCANESVTIELKNGMYISCFWAYLAKHLEDRHTCGNLNISKNQFSINVALTGGLYRHNCFRNNHICLTSNEYSAARSENDHEEPIESLCARRYNHT